MAQQEAVAELFRDYDLGECRKGARPRDPVAHQAEALARLTDWFRRRPRPHAGGLLVLPTGAGKTFTGMRFLARGPLSGGYKVLWLAHTHHLLEQAFHSLKGDVASISEAVDRLRVRVVSGTPGHFPLHSVKPSDDFVIATLPTIARGLRDGHSSLTAFLASSHGKLFVVFDEAHHAPAPSYRRLVQELRRTQPDMVLLGLTATPWYQDETRSGWLRELFPQEILYEVSASRLMAASVLARPVPEEPRTHMTVDFDDRDYSRWLSTNADIPEQIVTTLAHNRERNAFIARTYVDNRDKYGKTIIFADRWYQCETLCALLGARGVRAGAVYSHVDADPGGVEARARRAKDENAQTLESFRRGELDVLVNVRMLTEGTDVPDVQSVFLTRQTTSRVLLTQMVGRALRGPRFGGTASAFVVAFIDNWRQLINWATYDQLPVGGTDAEVPEYGRRPPLNVISIELVRRLARLLDEGVVVSAVPFVQLLPVGWYRVDYLAAVAGSDDHAQVRRLVLVFDQEEPLYRSFLEHVAGQPLERFAEEDLEEAETAVPLAEWRRRFFPEDACHLASDLGQDLLSLVRHVAQNGSLPRFFRFEERESHDLDALARQAIANDWTLQQIARAVSDEYNRQDRFWATLYPTPGMFKSQFDACVNRLQQGPEPPRAEPPGTGEPLPVREPSDEVKQQVKERDGRCLCCGDTRRLQVDHVNPWRFGGSNLVDNLQTLCRVCNQLKRDTHLSFRDPQTDLPQPDAQLPPVALPDGADAADRDEWECFLRRTLNFFYHGGVVHGVNIKSRGGSAHRWTVTLFAGNDPEWLRPHLPGLLERIRRARLDRGRLAPSELAVEAPDRPAVVASVSRAGAPTALDNLVAARAPSGQRPTRREILELLTLAQLRQLAVEAFDVDTSDLRRKGELVEALARSRYHSLGGLCGPLPTATLRELCEAYGRDATSHSKAGLIIALAAD